MIRDFFIDLTTLGNGFTGVSVYARNLAKYLEDTFECKVLAPAHLAANFRSTVVCPDPIYFKRGLVGRVPFWRRRSGLRLGDESFIYAPHMRGLIGKCRQVITIHDMISHRYPTRNVIENAFNSYVLPAIARNAAGIITVSQASRAEIARHFDIDDKKIAIVANGLDLARWMPAPMRTGVREPRYLLAVSANRPYKNTIELIRNHDLWSGRFRLKIVSSNTRYGRAIRQAVSASKLDHLVDFFDDISEKALIDLYRHCSGVVYPSLLEGFGRPALEAISVGCPVILSDIQVHREIFAGAAIFITPGDRGTWEVAFRCLDDERAVARLSAAGLVLAQTFGWDQAGEALKRALLQFEPQLADLLKR